MRQNFKKRVTYDGKTAQIIVIPEHRKDGMYYEINIEGIERFYMKWSVSDRFEVIPQKGFTLPPNLVLAVSDAIEEQTGR